MRRPARVAPALDRAAPAADERSMPSWMAGDRSPAAGKRMLYGVVAATCALVGIAALVLQLATRSGSRVPAAAAASSPAAGASAPAPRLASPAPPAVPLPAPAPATSRPVTRVAAASAPLGAPADPIQRQARCIEILQKASLERITTAETEFFKKECK
jgi:hypothetical protein